LLLLSLLTRSFLLSLLLSGPLLSLSQFSLVCGLLLTLLLSLLSLLLGSSLLSLSLLRLLCSLLLALLFGLLSLHADC
jgi:hypothetical protein